MAARLLTTELTVWKALAAFSRHQQALSAARTLLAG